MRICLSTLVLRKLNGLCLSQCDISSQVGRYLQFRKEQIDGLNIGLDWLCHVDREAFILTGFGSMLWWIPTTIYQIYRIPCVSQAKKTLFATLHKGHRIDWFTANLKVIITQKVHYILYVPSAPSIIKHPLGKLHLLIFHVHLLIEWAQKFNATFIPSASFRNRSKIYHCIIYSSAWIIRDFRAINEDS